MNESQKESQGPSQSINDLKEREREPLKASAKENAAAANQKQGGGGVQQQPTQKNAKAQKQHNQAGNSVTI